MVIQFAVGGTLLVGTSILFSRGDPVWGALLWSLPLVLFQVVILQWLRGQSNAQMSKTLLSAALTSIPLSIMLFVWWWALTKTPAGSHDVHGIWWSLAVALGVWCVMAIGFYFLAKGTRLRNAF